MRSTLKMNWIGLLGIVFFLALIALSHAVMIAQGKYAPLLQTAALWSWTILGLAAIASTRWMKSSLMQSLVGALGGIFLYMGIEYMLMAAAHRFGVPTVDGTKGEYQLMKYTGGFCLLVVVYLLFHEGVRCDFFIWLRRKLRLTRGTAVSGKVGNWGPRTAFESATVIWLFYVVLLILFDESLVGLHHPLTYVFLVATLGSGIYCFYRLLHITDGGRAIRWAIPTTILLWNGLEIPAKWGLYKEPWATLNPPIMLAIGSAFVLSGYLIIRDRRKTTVGVKLQGNSP